MMNRNTGSIVRMAKQCGAGRFFSVAATLLVSLWMCSPLVCAGITETEPGGSFIGAGDGTIHVIPVMSSRSCRDGDVVTIQAVVRSQKAVQSVRAEIAGVESLEMTASQEDPGRIEGGGVVGLYQAKWPVHGLAGGAKSVKIEVVDQDGHSYEDTSLSLSDADSADLADRANLVSSSGGYAPVGVIDATTFKLYENSPRSVVFDESTEMAYWGTADYDENFPWVDWVVKTHTVKGHRLLQELSACSVSSDQQVLRCAVLDAANGYAYFGSAKAPCRIIKVALRSGLKSPCVVSEMLLDSTDGIPTCAIPDRDAGYALFGCNGGRVVKIAFGLYSGPPTRVGELVLPSGEADISCVAADPVHACAYFGLYLPCRIVKVALGSGSALPVREWAFDLNATDQGIGAALVDDGGEYGYFAAYKGDNCRVVKVAFGTGGTTATIVGATDYSACNPRSGWGAVIDDASESLYVGTTWWSTMGVWTGGKTMTPPVLVQNYQLTPNVAFLDKTLHVMYVGSEVSPGVVQAVAMGSGFAPPVDYGSVSMDTREDFLSCGVLDAAGEYAYFATDTAPGRIVKVAVGDGMSTPTVIGSIPLAVGENFPRSAIADPAHGYAYFGTATAPGYVVKVRLPSGDSLPSRVGALTLGSGDDYLWSAVIDPLQGYGYFGTVTQPGRVIKVALGAGDNLPQRVAGLTLNAGEDFLQCAAIDTQAGYALFGTRTAPGRVVKVALGAGDSAPVRVAGLTLASGENCLQGAVFDPGERIVYLASYTNPSAIVKVAMGDGDTTPTRIGSSTANWGWLRGAGIDLAQGFAYFFSDTRPSWVVVVPLGVPGNPVAASFLPVNSAVRVFSVLTDSLNGRACLGSWTKPGQVSKMLLGRIPD